MRRFGQVLIGVAGVVDYALELLYSACMVNFSLIEYAHATSNWLWGTLAR